MRSRFYHPVLLIVLCLSFAFIGCSSGGGSGDGSSGGGDTGPFEMAEFFPLSSSWETDNWTLGVDAADYDINGTATKAMADTRDPGVLFWTNDENGWMLHGFLDEDGVMVVFEPPVLFTDSSCSVGDKHEGTYTIDGEEISYSIELVGVENVTVPAGTFNNCLKFVLHLWPSSELPSAYGYETFWLAKNVGFVKGMADDNSGSELFTDTGETRQLLSYHITPTEMTDDERAVREASELLSEYFRTGDMASVADMVSEDYFDRNCRDKATALDSWTNFMNNVSDYLEVLSIEEVTVDGNDAYILREYFATYTMSGTRYWDWNRRTSRWKKEIDGEWRTYGAHLDNFRPEYLGVGIRNDEARPAGTEEHALIVAEFFKCGIDEWIDNPPDVIQSLTLTGPPGSGITDLDIKQCWVGDIYPTERYFWCPDELQNAVSGFYTFRVEDVDGDYYVFTDYLELTPHLSIPLQVSPVDGVVDVPVNVTLDWDPVDLAEGYRVDMRYSDDGGNTWISMPNQKTSDTQVTVNLDPGTQYRWRVRAGRFDVYGETDTESRSDWSSFQTSDPPPAQIINPGFEEGKTGWLMAQTSGTDCTFTIDTDAYEGSQAAKLTINNGGYCMLGNETLIPINQTRSYTLSGYAKVSGGGVDHLSIAVWKSQDSGPETLAGFTNPNTFSGDYQLFELTVDLEAGDDIRLELGIDNTSGTGSVLYDSLSLD